MDTTDGSWGQVAWELVDLASGRVQQGLSVLRPFDFEVMITPPPSPPRLDLLREHPRQVVADGLGWLMTGGRGVSTKRARLTGGVWLVLLARAAPARPTRVHLSVKRERPALKGPGIFDVDDSGATAVQGERLGPPGPLGSLGLEWDADRDGFPELVGTTALTDISFGLRTAQGPLRRAPVGEVRILSGSTVRWPRAADGIRLAPKLRPGSGPAG